MTFPEKVRAALPMCGTHINLTDEAVTELESKIGFDYLWIDLEHTCISEEILHRHLLAARAGGTPVLVRVPVDDLTVTKRVLEMGIDGIVFPMVENAAHAEKLLSWTLYPPYGNRGCGPKGAVSYGMEDEGLYYKIAHEKLARFVMIERESAVQEAEKIAALPMLDGCIMGMHDLSGSIRDLGNIFGEANAALANRAIGAFRAAGKSVGISTFSTDPATLERHHSMHINMITSGADYEYIRKGAINTLAFVRHMQEENINYERS